MDISLYPSPPLELPESFLEDDDMVDIVSELQQEHPLLSDISDSFDLADFFSMETVDNNMNNNINMNNNNSSNGGNSSPTHSFSTEGFPETLEELEELENLGPGTDVSVKVEPPIPSAITTLDGYSFYTSPTSPAGSAYSTDNCSEGQDKQRPSIEGSDSGIDSDDVVMDVVVDVVTAEEDVMTKEEPAVPAVHRSKRSRRRPRTFSPDSSESDNDSDYDPAEDQPRKVNKVKRRSHKKMRISDDESEEFDSEEEKPSLKMKRVPSRHPIPQQRKKGRNDKITQWIVSLLRSPATNPSLITWEDEAAGRFKITDSAKYAKMWGEVKQNPEMDYEKLSRAMRYSYKNQELEMVKGVRLTYKFGPNMRDWRAKDRTNPNFEKPSGSRRR
jgi:hypothetical protein